MFSTSILSGFLRCSQCPLMGALLATSQLRTEDARPRLLTFTHKARMACTAKGRLTGPALSSSRMHRCHCHLNYFCFFSPFLFRPWSYWNWKHTDRHVILTNYFDLEIFLRSRARHLSGTLLFSCADALHGVSLSLSPSLFLFRGSSKLPNFTHSSNNRPGREEKKRR